MGRKVDAALLSTDAARSRVPVRPAWPPEPDVRDDMLFRWAWEAPAACVPSTDGGCNCRLRGWRFQLANGRSPYAGVGDHPGVPVTFAGVPGERVIAPDDGRGLYVAHWTASAAFNAHATLQFPGARMFEVTYDVAHVLSEGINGRELTVSEFTIARQVPADEVQRLANMCRKTDVRRITRNQLGRVRRYGSPSAKRNLVRDLAAHGVS